MTNNMNHFKNRQHETQSQSFERSGRFFCKSGSWFFKTREAINYGPYETRVECRYAYQDFIDVVSDSSDLPTDSFDYQDIVSDWQPPKINFS